MQTLTPLAQNGAEGPESAAVGETAAAAPDPLFSGPAPALWAGVGAFILIFIFVLMLIIRGRVIRPSSRAAKMKHEPPNYFEPAGADADISFDDDERPPETRDRAATHHHDDDHDHEEEEPYEDAGEEVHQDTLDGRHRGDLMASSDEEIGDEQKPAPVKKKSPFAGLFAKKPANEEKQAEAAEAPDPEEPEEAALVEESEDASFFDEPASRDYPSADHSSAPDYPPEPRQAAPSANDARLAHAESTAQQALQRAAEAEELARDLARANARAEQTITHGLKENEAALRAMSERLTGLAQEFQTRLETAPAHFAETEPHHDGLSEAHFAEFADLIGEQFESLRGAVNEAIDRLSRRIDHLPAAAPHAVAPTAARVQLSDLLSDALPSERYELSCKMSSGRTADACIHMPGRLAPIAVDARFPVEIFDTWRRARSETSNPAEEETALRRIILRHIADAGEKLIIKGETADCAMMFVPSEHILSELHTHFPDLVQESYRAKVWMVAPTSLMATLHTISAVIAGSGLTPASGEQSGELVRELTALRERIAALETSRSGNGAQERREDRHAAAPSSQPASYAGGGYYDEPRRPAQPRETEPANEDKPSFPLR